MDIGREEGYEAGVSDGLETGRREGELNGKIFAYYDMGCSLTEISAKLHISISTIEDVLNL